MSFPNIIHSSFTTQEHTANTVNRFHALGQRMEYEDGRKFRYILAAGTTLVANQVQQGKVILAGDDNLGVDAVSAVGATSITFTSATSTAVDYYNGGWVGITVTPGLGYIYKIKSSPLLTGGAGDILTLEPDSPIVVALTSSSEISLTPLPWNGVIVMPITTLTGVIVGVTAAPVTNAQYGWVQSGGVCVCEGAGSEVVGDNAAAIRAAEGRLGVGTNDINEVVGVYLTIAGGAGQGVLLDLRID